MNILFMCVANSARSQLAEGLCRDLLGPRHEVQSAGSHPSTLNPLAVDAMKEAGIDISKHWSKSVDDLSPDFVSKLDYVITLCADEVCPIVIAKAKRLHWPLPDPTVGQGGDAEKLARFRDTRDAIREKLIEFMQDTVSLVTPL